jgi:predicted nuclease of restriction endonuclease-like (RecB) superfamily
MTAVKGQTREKSDKGEYSMSGDMSDNPVSLTLPPAGYAEWLADLKGRIHTAQQRAMLAVNRELVLLYWQIGRDILARQASQGWGAKVIARLAQDLRAAFPEMKGFSPRNLKYMRSFAQAWPDDEFVQAVLAQLPWYHQLALLDKLSTPETRRWYAAQAIQHNWSRNVLVMQIETRLMERSGSAVTNLTSLPPDLAREFWATGPGATEGARSNTPGEACI